MASRTFNTLELPCRGCLGPLDAGTEAGLCGRCWAGLLPLPPERCPRCALPHGEDRDCPDPIAWEHGDALWNYHGGRPAFGALLVPGIKAGEWGWRAALLRQVEAAALPAFALEVDVVTAVPTATWKRWRRGGDFAEDAAAVIAQRLRRPLRRLLTRLWHRPGQTGRTESERRRLPRKAFDLKGGQGLEGSSVLLVDDVWTTGTSLLRCAERLKEGGAAEVRVLTLFRANLTRSAWD